MKKLSQLFKDSYIDLKIKWHQPVKLSDTWEKYPMVNQDNVYFYKIVAKRGETYRLIYIGMSQLQFIQKRLQNHDHKLKQSRMKDNNPGYALYVCMGELQKSDTYSYNWAIKHIPTLEKLLIISHSEFKFLENKRSIGWFSTGEWIRIENSGFKADGMYKMLSYGPCYAV